jgi:hypothetical protein
MYHPSHRRTHVARDADHTPRNVAIVVTVGVIAVVLVGLIPLPMSFSGQFASGALSPFGRSYTYTLPNTVVHVTWSTSPMVPITLWIDDSNGGRVYTGNGTSGNYTFSSAGGSYTFSAAPSGQYTIVSVDGSWTQDGWQLLSAR